MLGHALRCDGEAGAGPEPSRQCPESQPNKVPMQVLTPAFWEHQRAWGMPQASKAAGPPRRRAPAGLSILKSGHALEENERSSWAQGLPHHQVRSGQWRKDM